MTQNQKKNDNTQSSQGNVNKTGQGIDQQKGGQGGSHMGGKNPPAGGPETFESDQVNQGKGQDRTTQGGSQTGRGDPDPPVNPDRPMMAGGQQGGQGKQSGGQPGQNLQGKQGGNIGSQGGQNLQGGGYGGNAAGAGIGGATGGGEEE